MIPHKPESEQSMRERFPACLREICDVESAELGLGWCPSDRRENIFDFEDGLRMVVSRGDTGMGPPQIHFGASVMRTGPLSSMIVAGKVSLNVFLDLCVQRFRNISQINDRAIRLEAFFPERWIPHFIVYEEGSDVSSPG